MNLYFRVIYFILLRLVFRPKPLSILEPCCTTFWVNPLDLDINFHMNNGRYLSIMDIARFDLMWRAGILWKLFFGGYYPVVVSESIRFRKSLPNFKFFTIVTQVDSLDERDFYISQKFFYQNELYAEGFIKGRFRKRGQKSSISTEEIFAFAGLPRPSLLKSAKANAQIHTEELLAQSGS